MGNLFGVGIEASALIKKKPIQGRKTGVTHRISLYSSADGRKGRLVVAGSEEIRERLFSVFAENLSIYFPAVSDSFLCPVCHVLIGREEFQNKPRRVALAHILPRSLGGKWVALSCSACDNKSGSRWDSHARREKTIQEWAEGQATINGRFTCEHGDIGVAIRRRGSKWELREIPKQTHRNTAAKVYESMQANREGFRLRIKAYDEQKVALSYLHSALLALFACFGYEYVCLPPVSWLRQSLHNALTGTPFAVDLRRVVAPLTAASAILRERELSLGIVVRPEECQCFLLAFPAVRKNELGRAVVLPGFWDTDSARYRRMLESDMQSLHFDAVIVTGCPLDRLGDPAEKWFGHKLWRHVTQRRAP